MNRKNREKLLENLAAAAMLAVMGLLVASTSYLADSFRNRRDTDALKDFAGSSAVIGTPSRVANPRFTYLYPVKRRGREFWGTVATLEDRTGVAKVALLMTREGSLDSARVVDSVPAGLAFSRDGWFSEFLGRGDELPFPVRREELKRPDAVSGATESFEATADFFAVVSREARQATARSEKE